MKFERLRACHINMLENMAFVVGGVLVGIMAKLPANFMHQMSLVILGSRIVYIISYASVTRSKWAPLRTVWFLISNLAVLAMYWKAGLVSLTVSFNSSSQTSALLRMTHLSEPSSRATGLMSQTHDERPSLALPSKAPVAVSWRCAKRSVPSLLVLSDPNQRRTATMIEPCWKTFCLCSL